MPLEIEGATATTHPGDKVLGDRDISGGRQARNILRGCRIHHPGAAGHCKHTRHKRRFETRNGSVKHCLCHIGETFCSRVMTT